MAKTNEYISRHLEDFYSIPAHHHATRTALARALMEQRRTLRASGFSRKIFRKTAAFFYQDINDHDLMKPTRENLINLMRSLRAFSASPIRDYSTEYYSTCGMDDHQLDQRHRARQEAMFLERLIFCA